MKFNATKINKFNVETGVVSHIVVVGEKHIQAESG